MTLKTFVSGEYLEHLLPRFLSDSHLEDINIKNPILLLLILTLAFLSGVFIAYVFASRDERGRPHCRLRCQNATL